jgi:hypothetical protein
VYHENKIKEMEVIMRRYKVIIETQVWDDRRPSIKEVKETLSYLCGQNIDKILGDAHYEIGEVVEED